MTSQTFTVSGMTCQHCVIQVQALLSCIDGVQNISVSLSPPRVYVEGSRIDATVLSSALSSTRFSINTLTKTEEKVQL